MRWLISIFFVLISGPAGAEKKPEEIKTQLSQSSSEKKQSEVRNCTSTQEFIDAFEFLKSETDLALSEPQAIQLALQISRGCTGAAKRFISVYNIMKKSGIILRTSYEKALVFSTLDDERTENFIKIFKETFLANYLDLDFLTAYQLSLALSQYLKDRIKVVRDDFGDLVKFCTETKSIGFPLRTCAEYAIKVLDSGLYYNEALFPHFKKVFEFLTQGSGVKLPLREGLEVTYEVIAQGPKASENFFKAFNYATSPKMFLSHKQAIQLSVTLAKQSMMPQDEKKLQ